MERLRIILFKPPYICITGIVLGINLAPSFRVTVAHFKASSARIQACIIMVFDCPFGVAYIPSGNQNVIHI